LDGKIGGLQPTDLIILAARPAMGKSALAANIANNVAEKGTPVGFYSLEMSSEQVATRIICARAGLPVDRAMRGQLNDEELHRFGEKAAFVSGLPLTIDESGGISIAQLAARARRLKRKRGIGLLIVDYLQLMVGASKRGDNRVQEITEITTGLKALAKELRIPILALSQLSRKVEEREDKRPHLSDLRDSGSIEQDADVVMFISREEYYLEQERPSVNEPNALAGWMAKMAWVAGKAQVIISKQRHGATGIIQLQFDASLTRFSDLAYSGQGGGAMTEGIAA